MNQVVLLGFYSMFDRWKMLGQCAGFNVYGIGPESLNLPYNQPWRACR